MAGKRVAERGMMEESAKDRRVPLSASSEGAGVMDLVELREAGEPRTLPDLPELVLERIVKFVNPAKPKEVFRLMGSCRALRVTMSKMHLHALAHIQVGGDGIADWSSYAKFMQLVDLCADRLETIAVSTYVLDPLESTDDMTVNLPNLETLEVSDYYGCSQLVEQLVAAADNLERLVVSTTEISAAAFSRIQMLPLSFLDLSTNSQISGMFQSSNLETFIIRSLGVSYSPRITVSDQTVLSTLRSSPLSLRSLVLDVVRVVDSAYGNFRETVDSQCCRMSIYFTYGSLSFFNRLCHRNLTHLHLNPVHDQSEFYVSFFENARFSLRQLLFEANSAGELEAVVRTVFERNRELEIICLLMFREIYEVSESALSGIRNLLNLRGFLISGCVVSDPAALLAMISRQNHPHLQLVYWKSSVRQHNTDSILNGFRRLRLPSCVFRLITNFHCFFCSHSDYERQLQDSCLECSRTRDYALQCDTCSRLR